MEMTHVSCSKQDGDYPTLLFCFGVKMAGMPAMVTILVKARLLAKALLRVKAIIKKLSSFTTNTN